MKTKDLTKAQLQTELQVKGIAFTKSETKESLLKKLEEHTVSAEIGKTAEGEY